MFLFFLERILVIIEGLVPPNFLKVVMCDIIEIVLDFFLESELFFLVPAAISLLKGLARV